MKKLLASLSVALLVSNSAYSAQVVLSNVVSFDGTSDALIQNTDNSLLTGGVVAVGYFSAGFDLSGGIGAIGNLVTNFTVWTSGAVGNNNADLGAAKAGYYSYAGVGVGSILDGNPLLGRDLYLFVGNGATLASSTAFGLQFIGKVQNDSPNEQTYLSSQVPVSTVNGIGTVGTFTGDATGFGSATYSTLKLVEAIPEPSSALLGLLGAVGFFRRRR